MKLSEKVKGFPRESGVYIFKSSSGEILYVGKAKNLRSRVNSYFSKRNDGRRQIEFLKKRTSDVEYITTDSEKEALLLENTLIKEHRPRYNFELRDDKTYVSIRVGMNHEFPSISIVRRATQDGAKYFGPYDSSLAAREAIEQITRFFRIRTCADREFMNRIRPCLKFDIGRCLGPCAGKVAKYDYDQAVSSVLMFLTGQSAALIKTLKEKMNEASEKTLFEDAARYRDAISMLGGLTEKQKVVRHGGGSFDAIAIARQDDQVAICVLGVRNGLLISRRNYFSREVVSEDADVLSNFIIQKYKERSEIPSLIATSKAIKALSALQSELSDKAGKKVVISTPSRGDKLGIIKLAEKNAVLHLSAKIHAVGEEELMASISAKLGLAESLQRIECVDISNLQGRESVGSIVSFVGQRPDKGSYRIYKIQTLDTPDDYASMREVISRRFVDSISRPMPDLLLVDGGKGQLAVAMRVVEELTLDLRLASIAKAKSANDCDRIFIPHRSNPVNLKKGSRELLFLQRVRDEAHRFGINAHRKLRGKKSISSPLDDIPGVGKKLRFALMDKFENMEKICVATDEELFEVRGVTKKIIDGIRRLCEKN